MFFKLALAALLRITDPTHSHKPHLYTSVDFAMAMPYTSSDLGDNLPYTVADWEKNLARDEACRCLTIKMSPDGSMVVGPARPCSCKE